MQHNLMTEPSYTWKNKYILPYESKWSKRLKFCYLNGISWSAFMKDKEHRELVGYGKPNKDFDNTPTIIARDLKAKYVYCPQCIRYGYHSNIHQIKTLDNCFLHPETTLEIIEDDNIYRQGSYIINDVRVENIINNSTLYMLIKKYIKKRESDAPIYTNVILGKYDASTYFESTRAIIQKYFFLQENIVLNGVKELFSVDADDINNLNQTAAKRVIVEIAKQQYKTRAFLTSDYSLKEYIDIYSNIIMQKDSYIPHKMMEDSLGWMFYAFMLSVIKNEFGGLKEFYRIASKTNEDSEAVLHMKEAYKYAILIALYAITGTYAPDAFFRGNSNIWTRGYSKCRYAINIRFDLGELEITSQVQRRYATQFATDIIIQNCFWYITNDIYQKFIDGTLKLDAKEITNKINTSLSTPQYIVMCYKKKCTIYACYPV